MSALQTSHAFALLNMLLAFCFTEGALPKQMPFMGLPDLALGCKVEFVGPLSSLETSYIKLPSKQIPRASEAPRLTKTPQTICSC